MYFFVIFLVVRMFLKFSSLWFATVLCVYYCVKITNYNHSSFIYVKVRINKIVTWLLLASLLTSLASSLPFGWFILTLNGSNSTNSLLKNSTVQDIIVVQNHTNQDILHGLGSSLPFLIFCVATFLLVRSLWLHTRQMRSSLDTHFRVVKSMVFFLFLNIIFFSSMNVIFSEVLPVGNPWFVFLLILTFAYPFLHSAVLIFYNKKLKQTFLDICHRAVKFTQKQRIPVKSSTDFTTGTSTCGTHTGPGSHLIELEGINAHADLTHVSKACLPLSPTSSTAFVIGSYYVYHQSHVHSTLERNLPGGNESCEPRGGKSSSRSDYLLCTLWCQATIIQVVTCSLPMSLWVQSWIDLLHSVLSGVCCHSS
ncbi:taste receptor type 2 member 40-like [Ascaphus truei]|uniref:taste receptor type 2 member 40-like n=1 Tax=Ascaphus truei TaxID=8439 RepID=UPI003F5A0EE8